MEEWRLCWLPDTDAFASSDQWEPSMLLDYSDSSYIAPTCDALGPPTTVTGTIPFSGLYQPLQGKGADDASASSDQWEPSPHQLGDQSVEGTESNNIRGPETRQEESLTTLVPVVFDHEDRNRDLSCSEIFTYRDTNLYRILGSAILKSTKAHFRSVPLLTTQRSYVTLFENRWCWTLLTKSDFDRNPQISLSLPHAGAGR
jgi:hypothetical protein